jgi:hypothetical protein
VGLGAAAGAGVCLGLGLIRDSPREMGLYLANVLVFLLYSVPPVRLKCRGVWGVLADACGALVIPALWISVAVSRQGTAPLLLPVGIALVTWTPGCGVRLILTHQADDLSNDLRSGTATPGLLRGREGLERLGRHVALPLEIVSLPVLLWAGGGWLSLVVLLACALGQVTVARKREIPLRCVDRQPGTWLPLFTVSFTLVPLLLLPRLLQQSPWAWLIPPLHLLLFAPGWRAKGYFQFRGPGGALRPLFI